MATPEDPSVAALVAAALGKGDEGHDRWHDVYALQERGGTRSSKRRVACS